MRNPEQSGWQRGFRIGIGLGVGTFGLAASFGAFAALNGVPPWLAVLMSLLAFSGSAQFAFVTTFPGGLWPALGAASLINLRFIPMAATTADVLKGGFLRRTLEAQSVNDGSWAAAHRPDGTIEREVMIGATLIQWPAWALGTALGAFLLPSPETVRTIGLDAIFPAFFTLLLLDMMRSQPIYRSLTVASICVSALALLVVPAGVAMLIGCTPALLAAGKRFADRPRAAAETTP
ncbi:MAG TPA: AzlC family ABC transporter permease [Thermomicrobiales bacterium]|nr:AzlC family ABC transporter permease [Thermomicrobiales bacterium]